MFVNLSELKIKEAFECNPYMFITWPFVGLEILYVFYRGGNGKDIPKWNIIVLFTYIGLLMLYGIIRNV